MGNQPSSAGGNGSNSRPNSRPGSGAASSSKDVNYTSTQANGTGTMTAARKPPQTKVILNVYEPAKPQASMPGFGVYHTGIEFSGVEYSFAGGADAGSGTGVMSQVPRATPAGGDWKFKEAIELGTVTCTSTEFDQVLKELKDAFPANTYDLLHRNCNHFTTAVAKRLGLGSKYPGWVNRAASWGSMFSAPPANHKPLEVPKPKESVFKTTTGYRMDGGVVAPKVKTAEMKKAEKEKEKSEKKEPTKASASSSSGGKSARKNPWADPSFVPPGMRDPVTGGFVKATTTSPDAGKPATSEFAPAAVPLANAPTTSPAPAQ